MVDTNVVSTRFKSLKEQAPTLAVEAVSVVFAVLLALGINGWRQRSADAKLARDAMARIRTEITQNQENLEGVLGAQSAEIDALAATIDRFTATEPTSGTVEFSFRTEQLPNAAWQTAMMTQAVRFIDFEVISQASAMYELQDMVNQNVRRVLDSMATAGVGGKEQVVANLQRLHASAQQLLSLEEQLLARYRTFLERFGG